MSFLDFIKRKTYSVIFPTWDNLDIPEGSRITRKSQRDFLTYNQISLYTNRAIDKRAEKVSEVQFVLTQGEDVIEKHPFLTLLNRPNPFHTGAQFWKLYQKYLDVTGSVFILLVSNRELFAESKVSEMHLLRPDLMKVLFDGTTSEIIGYEYSRPGGSPIRFEPKEILYSFNPDPLNPLHGESILRAGARAIDTELDLSSYQSRVLKNGGRVDGVFRFEAALNKQQLNELKESYKEQYAEARQAGRPLFLGGDAKYERVSLSPDELSYLESKKATLDDICLMTGVPRAILARTSDETFANADASIAIFLRETIKPLLANLTTILDWRLVPEDLDLSFIDPTPEDIDRKVKIITAANTVNALTINEKREMLGMAPHPAKEADEILIPFSVVPLKASQKSQREEPPEEKQLRKADDFRHPLRDAYVRQKYGELMVKRMDRREAELLAEMERYFKGQEKRLIEHLTEVKRFRKKELVDEAFDPDLELRLAKGTVLPFIEEFLKEAGIDAHDFLGSEYEFVLSSEIRSWLDERGDLFAGEITATTYEKLKDQFEESLTAGENRQQLIRRIEDTYEGFAENRARTIARTEVHAATQKGTFEGYRQANAPVKIWVTVGDAHVRHSHAAQDGQEVPIDHPFANGLMFPGDPKGPPEEVINCRCTV